ncbi:hypothetical protein GALMADRAFT_223141 [Galerina marginata CBS 339.88]|uniref:Uncharacterized protein n=1 Tax=Galerina marginata (strain CBS 339.88) TaxID=685588 RepID=A0A067TMQ0_GALM3|nr:hypothetical protein GALMADRAFT_223141 [Galerina marginata CBS 339.88]
MQRLQPTLNSSLSLNLSLDLILIQIFHQRKRRRGHRPRSRRAPAPARRPAQARTAYSNRGIRPLGLRRHRHRHRHPMKARLALWMWKPWDWLPVPVPVPVDAFYPRWFRHGMADGLRERRRAARRLFLFDLRLNYDSNFTAVFLDSSLFLRLILAGTALNTTLNTIHLRRALTSRRRRQAHQTIQRYTFLILPRQPDTRLLHLQVRVQLLLLPMMHLYNLLHPPLRKTRNRIHLLPTLPSTSTSTSTATPKQNNIPNTNPRPPPCTPTPIPSLAMALLAEPKAEVQRPK